VFSLPARTGPSGGGEGVEEESPESLPRAPVVWGCLEIV